MKGVKLALGSLLGLYTLVQIGTLALMLIALMRASGSVHPLFFSKMAGVVTSIVVGCGLAFLAFRSALRGGARDGTPPAGK